MRSFKTGQRVKVNEVKMLAYCKRYYWRTNFEDSIIIELDTTFILAYQTHGYFYNDYFYPLDCLTNDRLSKLKRIINA